MFVVHTPLIYIIIFAGLRNKTRCIVLSPPLRGSYSRVLTYNVIGRALVCSMDASRSRYCRLDDSKHGQWTGRHLQQA